MNKLLRLFLDGLYYRGMAMTGGDYRDACREIQKTITIDIPLKRTVRLPDVEGIGPSSANVMTEPSGHASQGSIEQVFGGCSAVQEFLKALLVRLILRLIHTLTIPGST